jgi:ribonuclease G
MKEVLISSLGSDYQVAIVEQGKLIHFFSETVAERSLVGNIYLGTVVRVLPGMQSAFVSIGLDRTAFLHVRDIVSSLDNQSIEALVHQGKKLLVQVLKDPIGSKGARLTTEITLPSTHLVYRPYEKNNGVSQKIELESERQRLIGIMAQLPLTGLIARTAAEEQSLAILEKDCEYLAKRWKYIQEAVLSTEDQHKLIYEDLILPYRLLRDFAKYPISKIIVDRQESLEQVQSFVKDFLPHLHTTVLLELSTQGIFDYHRILEQFKQSLKPEVVLKSGGSIIIEQTESMTTIDVNTSRFVGKKNHDETILKTNIEAARVIAHQIQLRGLGGLIVIDFIDMQQPEEKLQVYHVLKESLKNDVMPTHVLPMSELGLIEMTRKRTTESFGQKYFLPCKHCHGRGQTLQPSAIALEIICQLMRMKSSTERKKMAIISSQAVINILHEKQELLLKRFDELNIEAIFSVDDYLSANHFELIQVKN